MASRKPRPRKKHRPAEEPALPSTTTPKADHRRIPIVGIGASAGGVDALLEFFKTIPDDPGMAFIVVQHLDPTRISEMPGLLARRTRLPVTPADDMMPIQPNRVYTIPPDRYVVVQDGHLRVTLPTEPRGLRLPVDALFYSMAEHAAECAVGVILSGNGSDGSLGLRSIKGHGGLAVVQDPSTAEYDGMPRNAIATGVVDHILGPTEMMEMIRGFADHDYVQKPIDGDRAPIPNHVTGILSLLHARRNVDFSAYKKGTLLRRIDRRMSVKHVTQGGDYLRMLRESTDEVNALFNDMLIQVTRFFREPETWKILETEVLARLVAEADKDHPIRVWVPGCASGEEAYSIAILLLEMVDRAQKHIPIQIFATDLDQGSLDQARQGAYPDSIAAHVSPERLQRFFVKSEHRFTVNQVLRDTCIFAHHNMLVDAPFSRLDLISCRNVLIYLEAVIQRRVFDLFHFSLRPGRFLFLGSSETVGAQTDLFQPIDKKTKVFRRLGTVRGDRLRLSLGAASATVTAGLPGPAAPSRENATLQKARDLVLERHTRATALINRRNEILALFGPTHDYLTQPTGALTADLLYWVKEGVRAKLRSAIQSAIRRQEKVTLQGLRTQRQGKPVLIGVTVEPLNAQPESDGLVLVVFEDEVEEARPRRGSRKADSSEPVIRQLEYELKVARDDLQTSVEQLESSNEELRATNEEILSMNEELQSTNEELETSKEELQSVNEELTTVNNQLEQRVIEQQTLNDDITNLLTSTDLPTLFLDRRFLIRRFTPATTRLFRLISTDIGRPIQDISRMVEDPTLLEDASEVLSRLRPVEREVRGAPGQGYLRKVLPYRTMLDRIDGVVITYTDISDRLRADAGIREARDFAEAVIATLREPLLVLDQRFVVKSANGAFYRVFQLSPDQVVGRRVFDLGSHEWNVPEFRRLLEQTMAGKAPITNYEVRREFAGVGERVICVNASALVEREETVVLLAFEDITSRMEAELARNEALRQLVSYDEKERHRLALELHDETGQHLTAFLLGLATLRDSYADRPEVRKVVQALQGKAEELARNLHGISLQLRPRALDDHGLERALFNYAEDIRLRHGLEIDLQTAGKDLGRLPGPMEIVLYRVTQEALTNVVKHARASKVSIVTSRKQKEVHLIIEDDGDGFEPADLNTDGKHLGLRGMRERVLLAGGTLTVESNRGAGTTLFARLPIRESSNDGDDD
jgi:two-component system CheB/CheR fusion protein